MKLIFWIGFAGFCGTILRYGCLKALGQIVPVGSLATLILNVMGSAVAGLLSGYFATRTLPQTSLIAPIILIGLMGAFTTYSTYAMESARLLLEGRFLLAGVNILLHNTLGITAALGGFALMRSLA